VEVAVQVNGKVRDRLVVARDASKEAIEEAARSSAKVREAVGGGAIVKVIVVPGKLVNVVVK
jgi:leucyl-tRNA synthetase